MPDPEEYDGVQHDHSNEDANPPSMAKDIAQEYGLGRNPAPIPCHWLHLVQGDGNGTCNEWYDPDGNANQNNFTLGRIGDPVVEAQCHKSHYCDREDGEVRGLDKIRWSSSLLVVCEVLGKRVRLET